MMQKGAAVALVALLAGVAQGAETPASEAAFDLQANIAELQGKLRGMQEEYRLWNEARSEKFKASYEELVSLWKEAAAAAEKRIKHSKELQEMDQQAAKELWDSFFLWLKNLMTPVQRPIRPDTSLDDKTPAGVPVEDFMHEADALLEALQSLMPPLQSKDDKKQETSAEQQQQQQQQQQQEEEEAVTQEEEEEAIAEAVAEAVVEAEAKEEAEADTETAVEESLVEEEQQQEQVETEEQEQQQPETEEQQQEQQQPETEEQQQEQQQPQTEEQQQEQQQPQTEEQQKPEAEQQQPETEQQEQQQPETEQQEQQQPEAEQQEQEQQQPAVQEEQQQEQVETEQQQQPEAEAQEPPVVEDKEGAATQEEQSVKAHSEAEPEVQPREAPLQPPIGGLKLAVEVDDETAQLSAAVSDSIRRAEETADRIAASYHTLLAEAAAGGEGVAARGSLRASNKGGPEEALKKLQGLTATFNKENAESASQLAAVEVKAGNKTHETKVTEQERKHILKKWLLDVNLYQVRLAGLNSQTSSEISIGSTATTETETSATIRQGFFPDSYPYPEADPLYPYAF